MPVLEADREVRQRRPEILVENRLDPGRHTFRLVVVDDSGLQSAPALLTIEVRRRTIDPGPVILENPRPTGPIPVLIDRPVLPVRSPRRRRP
jgi:hypothetical protein